jgi:hydroxyacylglutathione hydrolase
VFCGDTLFSCGCGRLFEGTPAQMLASLDALAALPGDTRVHCAHEYTLSNIRFALACEPAMRRWPRGATTRRCARAMPTLPTTIAHERAVNPFLRADSGDPRDARGRVARNGARPVGGIHADARMETASDDAIGRTPYLRRYLKNCPKRRISLSFRCFY